MAYVLETHHVNQTNGMTCRVSEIQEYDDLDSAQQAIFIYKLADNIGYTLYECGMDDFPTAKTYHEKIHTQWFDKNAFRG